MATEISQSVREICADAKAASRQLARLSDQEKDVALIAIAEGIDSRVEEILAANARDLEEGKREGLDSALMDRLKLTEERIAAIAQGVRDIEALSDPVGEVIEGWKLKNGLHINQVRVPLGVIAIVYEARPNVTVDAAALCLKSGNACVLRGSSAAVNSNRCLGEIVAESIAKHGISPAAVGLLSGGDRAELKELATQEGLVDLIIPRGGEGLKDALKAVATVPVMYAAAGNCHVYVDADVDIDMALDVTLDAKTDRPGTCNSAESLIVNAASAPEFVPKAVERLVEAGVEVRADERARALSGEYADKITKASEEDWGTEFHAMIIALKVVDSLDEAIDHINHYGSHHSEAILTNSVEAKEQFTEAVDAACVYVNASTRFTDGGVFGMGAEIGNSTQKLHARGPVGLKELTTYKYVIEGAGQRRGDFGQ